MKSLGSPGLFALKCCYILILFNQIKMLGEANLNSCGFIRNNDIKWKYQFGASNLDIAKCDIKVQ
jgi:hypothetical protein